jgi:hypothetical protein
VTELALDLANDTATDRGIVGRRQLVAVQTFDIARLTSHPVALVPGAFVAVTGRGPRQDSNESGKTSFLAAVSLLLGDPEWRLTAGTGGAAAAQLLFQPEVAGVTAQRFRAAPHGYVVGLFADPDDPAASALAVWCRINASTPHLQVRWTPGVHLADGDSDRERHERADELWKAIGSRGELGPKSYVDALYGDTPRCLAYVARRGSLRSAPSLLQMDAGAFTPEHIGTALIALSGRAAAFETEAEQRQRLAAAEERLTAKEADAEHAAVEEDRQLEAVRHRDTARARLAEAAQSWRLHFARGYLDVLSQAETLDAQLADATVELEEREAEVSQAQQQVGDLEAEADLDEQAQQAGETAEDLRRRLEEARGAETTARVRLADLRPRREELVRRADGWAGPDAAACASRVSKAEESLGAARVTAARAVERRDAAADELEAILGGGGGRAGAVRDRLRDAGIDGVALLDAVSVDDHPGARAFWEPRLALYRDAVAVPVADLDRAASAVPPGTVLVTGDTAADPGLPMGIREAPAPTRGFLAAIAERGVDGTDPARVNDPVLGVTVVGGFTDPIAGRDARAASARTALDDWDRGVSRAEQAVRFATAALAQARDDLERARAAEDVTALEEDIRALEDEQKRADRQIQELQPQWTAADRQRVQAEARLQNHERDVELARTGAAQRERERDEAARAARDIETRRVRLAVAYWEQGWGEDADAAWQALADEPRSENRLRRAASDGLLAALTTLGIEPDGSGAPNEEIAQVARRRDRLADEPEGTRAAPSFGQVTAPLRDWLYARADLDRMTEDDITRLRAERERGLQLLRAECGDLRGTLDRIQDAVEQRIMQSLETISVELDRLDQQAEGFGADLQIVSVRPEGPRAPWRWRVTPRWRRAHGGPLVRYDNQTNSAREKLFTVHLVLAALLAAPEPQGRVLVLDELGDSLGVTHRRDVLRAIAQTAAVKRVTVLGTCQDSVLPDAAAVCGQVLYFSYPSRSEALNHPTRMFGFDADRRRVELTADALRAGRPRV